MYIPIYLIYGHKKMKMVTKTGILAEMRFL